jgi:hypothetical protein
MKTSLFIRLAALLIPALFFPARLNGSARAPERALMERHYTRIIADRSDLDALADLAAYAAQLAGEDRSAFMRLMNGLILDAPTMRGGNWLALLAGPWSRVRQRLHARWPWVPPSPALGRFGSAGFRADDGSNQVQHVWYSAAVAYRWGAPVADALARYHEWNAPGLLRHLPGTGGGCGTGADLTLSRQGIALGRALANGTLSPRQVSGWLQRELGPPHPTYSTTP